MNVKDQINAAIAAHGQWKARLRTAIEKGSSEFTVEKVTPDNNCEFGRWLYGDPGLKKSPSYEKVRQMHAEFHREVARILALAVTGKKAQAMEAISIGQPFAQLSARLTSAMVDWRAAE